MGVPGGGGVLLIMTEAPAERVAFLRVCVYERVGKSVILFFKKSPKWLTDAFNGCEKV